MEPQIPVPAEPPLDGGHLTERLRAAVKRVEAGSDPVEVLVELLDDPNPRIGRAACASLGGLDPLPDEVVQRMGEIALGEDVHAVVRREAARQLVRLARRHGSARDALTELRKKAPELLDEEDDRPVRQSPDQIPLEGRPRIKMDPDCIKQMNEE